MTALPGDETAGDVGAAHRVASRRANERTASANPTADAQGLVEFACECMREGCDRSVKVPHFVYLRMLDAGDQFLVQPGHHALAGHRTIVTRGLMCIEERV